MPMSRRQFAAAVTAAVPAAFATKLIGAAVEIERPDDRFLRIGLNALLDVTAVPGFGVGVMRDGKLAWERYQGVMEAGTTVRLAPTRSFQRRHSASRCLPMPRCDWLNRGSSISIDR